MINEKLTYIAPEADIDVIEQEDIVLISTDDVNTKNLDQDSSYKFASW